MFYVNVSTFHLQFHIDATTLTSMTVSVIEKIRLIRDKTLSVLCKRFYISLAKISHRQNVIIIKSHFTTLTSMIPVIMSGIEKIKFRDKTGINLLDFRQCPLEKIFDEYQ